MELKENQVFDKLSEHIMSTSIFPRTEVKISKRKRIQQDIDITKRMLKETRIQRRYLKIDLIVLRFQKLSLLWRKSK